MNPDEEEFQVSSREYEFYRQIFPHPFSPFAVAKMQYDRAIERFPERFNMSKIGEIFDAWNSALRSPLTYRDLDSMAESRHILYTYDNLTYRSTCWKSRYTLKTSIEEIMQLDIKLSNDGYLYKPSRDLRTTKRNIKRHDNTSTWCILDRSEAQWFRPLIAFAKKFFGIERVKFKVFYNFESERIDFKAFDNPNSRSLAITFEPGGPFVDFEDGWLESDD